MIARCPTFVAALRMPGMMRDSEISQDNEHRMTPRARWDAKTIPWWVSTQEAYMSEVVLGRDRSINSFRAFFRVALVSEMILCKDSLPNNFRVVPLSLRYRRTIDAGVWNGHSYDHAPAATIPM